MIFGIGTDEKDPRRFAMAIQQLSAGRSNAVVKVTLAANANHTVVDFDNVSDGTAPIPVPRTAHAAAELAAGTLYISAVTRRQFTVSHANNAQTDRDFLFVCIG